MIQMPFDRISKDDIQVLLANEVREGKTIEYKETLPGGTNSDKKEFLADVSSFAGAVGGDLLYGVVEKRDSSGRTTGIPESVLGLADINADQEILRLEGIIRDGIKPRIAGIHLRTVEGFPNGPVLLVRIPKSYAAPHMISFQDWCRFYSRNSAGKYLLDVDEIRAAFALSEKLPERIQRFRDERIAEISAGTTPLRMREGLIAVLHLIPIVSLDKATDLDIRRFEREPISPMCSSSALDWKFDLDGVVFFNPPPSDEKCGSYARLFRNGILEAVSAFSNGGGGRKVFPSPYLESEVIKKANGFSVVQRKLDLDSPLVIVLSLLGTKGYIVRPDDYRDTPSRIDRDRLLLPPIIVQVESSDAAEKLRPLFDYLWQAAGWDRCRLYDEQGHLHEHAP